MKTSELTGAALNWAVGKAEGLDDWLAPVNYCGKWEHGGPIIEREGVGIWMYEWNEQGEAEQGWYAEDKNGDHVQKGPAPLIAAMRCYVANKLGDEVNLSGEFE